MTKKIRAAHILVKTEEEATAIVDNLASGGSFEAIAQAKSQCPSGKRGGDLGWFGHGQMVREFEKTAFSMKKGEISGPVKTQFGWHIIKVLDTK